MASYSSSMTSPTPKDRQNRSAYPQSTPPFLIYRDFDEASFEEIFQRAMEKTDVTNLMAQAIDHLDDITNHLKSKGCGDSANEIGKHMLSMVRIFNDATADWDIEKCLVHSPKTRSRPANGSHLRIGSATSIDGQAKNSTAGTWAAVAATPTPKTNVVVKHHPSDGVKCSVNGTLDERPASSRDMRVVWVRDLENKKRRLEDLTKVITEGPLLSLAYSEADHAICIIFQRSDHAQLFLQRSSSYKKQHGRSLLGDQAEFLEGQPYRFDDVLSRMEPPFNERRRLTFARAKLFTCEGVSEQTFKRDIYELVGETNVEQIWLFNTGNATIVFSGTSIARLVRNKFIEMGRMRNSPYRDIQVSFSHDPCERPLHLISALNGMASSRPTVPRAPSGSFAGRMGPPPLSPRQQYRNSEEGGWKTVGPRRR